MKKKVERENKTATALLKKYLMCKPKFNIKAKFVFVSKIR
jgi:hypothetical protein